MGSDQRSAIDWLDKNTAQNSTILNFITGFDSGGIGGDAGQWIPSLTGRRIIFPAISTPENIPISDIQKRLEIMKLIQDNKVDTYEFKSLIKKFNIDYIFVTDRYITPNDQFRPVNPENFINKLDYKMVFQSGQTYVFQVVNQ